MGMTDKRYAAYGFNRTAKQMIALAETAGIEVLPDKIFVDTANTNKAELAALQKMLKTVSGVAVLVHQKSDFGQGAMAAKVVQGIESGGNSIIVPEIEARPRGRPKADDFTDGQKAKYRELLKANTYNHVITVVHRDTGLVLTRGQLKTRLKK